MTGGKFSLQKVYWVERNHFWVAIKNLPWFLLVTIPIITVFRYLAQGYSILKSAGELNQFTKNNHWPAIVSTYFKAYVDMFAKLPDMLRKRRIILKKHGLSNLDMFNLIWEFHLSMVEILGMRKR